MEKDVFEDLRGKVGCAYISDLPTPAYVETARRCARELDFEAYPLRQLSDLAEYLYSEQVTFEDHKQAGELFIERDT